MNENGKNWGHANSWAIIHKKSDQLIGSTQLRMDEQRKDETIWKNYRLFYVSQSTQGVLIKRVKLNNHAHPAACDLAYLVNLQEGIHWRDEPQLSSQNEYLISKT